MKENIKEYPESYKWNDADYQVFFPVLVPEYTKENSDQETGNMHFISCMHPRPILVMPWTGHVEVKEHIGERRDT